MQKPYFKSLDTLRIYAAVSVVLSHIVGTLAPSVAPLPSQFDILVLNGWEAVTLFFVLSGFLITYLLLEERKQTGTIDISAFYLRRITRIWPLYFLIVVASYIVFPLLLGHVYPMPSTEPRNVLAMVFMFPQIPHGLSEWTTYQLAGHLWSIGVEELFYLVWPLLVVRFRNLPVVCLVIIIVRVGLEGIANALGASPGVILTIQLHHYESMAIGALIAWMVQRRHRLLWIIYHPMMQASVIALTVGLILIDPENVPLTERFLITSVIFAVLIANVATNPRSRLKLAFPGSRALGNASYGVYMWHPFVIFLTTLWLGYISGWIQIAIVGLAIVAGLVSYYGYERRFLRFKDRRRSFNTVRAI